jgi:hypothetical protein
MKMTQNFYFGRTRDSKDLFLGAQGRQTNREINNSNHKNEFLVATLN